MTAIADIQKWLKAKGQGTASALAKERKISRQLASRYLSKLVQMGVAHKSGATKNSRYHWGRAAATSATKDHLHLNKKLRGLLEDQVFERVNIDMNLKGNLNKSAYRIAYYAFSEMLNNAIDHSNSVNAVIDVDLDKGNYAFTIKDNGIGIFNRLKRGFHLKSDLEAIEHLFKGKQTTFTERHSGKGIFFTSRISDVFSIRSNELKVIIDNRVKDQIVKKTEKIKGTEVTFSVRMKTKKSLEDLFREYSNEDYDFDRNRVRLKLSAFPDLISRSQARRLLAGLDKFRKIVFDFEGVNGIGQAYADEVFRVFKNQNPKIKLDYVNASEPVIFMIKRVAR